MEKVLTIAGSDPSGGAGIQGDLKTFSANKTFGMSVITAITAQNTNGVYAIYNIPKELIAKQIEVLFEDIPIDGVKIGMVSIVETIEVIANTLKKYEKPPIVLDPVMVSKSGAALLQPEAIEAMIEHLFPLAEIVTPNIPEAEVLTGKSIVTEMDMRKACEHLIKLGCQSVLLKGGHLEGSCIDLYYDGSQFMRYEADRIKSNNTHGTGCALSSSICANLAKGKTMDIAISEAKMDIYQSIKEGFSVGSGVGALHHFHSYYGK